MLPALSTIGAILALIFTGLVLTFLAYILSHYLARDDCRDQLTYGDWPFVPVEGRAATRETQREGGCGKRAAASTGDVRTHLGTGM